MEQILNVVRVERDKILSLKKLKEIELLKAGRLAGTSFKGSQLTGMGGSSVYGAPPEVKSPTRD